LHYCQSASNQQGTGRQANTCLDLLNDSPLFLALTDIILAFDLTLCLWLWLCLRKVLPKHANNKYASEQSYRWPHHNDTSSFDQVGTVNPIDDSGSDRGHCAITSVSYTLEIAYPATVSLIMNYRQYEYEMKADYQIRGEQSGLADVLCPELWLLYPQVPSRTTTVKTL
jgi:hypothetical protein